MFSTKSGIYHNAFYVQNVHILYGLLVKTLFDILPDKYPTNMLWDEMYICLFIVNYVVLSCIFCY